jgi:hypothetical protein
MVHLELNPSQLNEKARLVRVWYNIDSKYPFERNDGFKLFTRDSLQVLRCIIRNHLFETVLRSSFYVSTVE